VKPSRWVEFTPAFDKRNTDPNKNYGIGSVNIRFLLRGPRGVVQFLILSGWYLPEVQSELGRGTFHDYPLAADLGYHSPVPMYEGQEPITDSCEYLDGRPCYYDGSSLAAKRVYERLLREGDAGVWSELEDYYTDRFGGQEVGGEQA